MSDESNGFERIRVMIETSERTFRGYVHQPVSPPLRLSDYVNSYDRAFICLTDVQVNDRGQQHRAGDRREFVAVAVSAITYLTPMNDGEA